MNTTEQPSDIDVRQLVQGICSMPDHEVPDAAVPMPLRTFALPYLTWDRQFIEDKLGTTLPSGLRQLWDESSGLVLFWDVTFGQWGLVVWSPEQALLRQRMFREHREEQFRPGDLIIGEFLGDSDLLLLRSDPSAEDYGAIVIALPIDPRAAWPVVSASLLEFLAKFLQARGAKFWE